ncbi:MAG TPA: 3'-5' exonuclease, partial [Tepidisphaeraceae bacterium]
MGCFRAIVEQLRADPLGEPIFLIVPKQETFTAERTLTCESGLSGFCRVHVVSFESLGEEILAECGGTAIPQVSELGRQMVIGHLLRKHEKELKFYASAARQTGLAAELDATFAEIERCGKTVGDLADAANKIQNAADESSLIAKLNDLRLLYEKYSEHLGQDRLDPHRRLEQVLDSLSACQHIKNALVYVDGFLEFTEYERRMLAGLANVCRAMRITLLIDPHSPVVADVHQLPHELSLFHRTENAYRRLWFAFNEVGITPQVESIEQVTRFESPSLKQIEQHLFAPRPPICKTVENIELIEAPDRRAEVDAAARHVRKLLESNLRFRDVVVLMRDLNEYQELIDASFAEHGIPYFVDRRRTAMHHPLIQFTRSILQIALHHWPHDAVMTLLKTELAGLQRDEVDELENYVLLHRIRGTAWTDANSWTYRRKLTRSEEDDFSPQVQIELDRIDAMRRKIAGKIQPLITFFSTRDPLPLRTIVVELFNAFTRFDIRGTLRKWIDRASESNQLEIAAEHEQVWAELIALFDQMADVLGDERISAEDFVNILETGLERFDLAIAPPTVDQVLVGTVDRTRSARPRAAIILGMNDNQFPRVPSDGSILSDRERRTLSQNRIELDPDGQRTLLNERLLGYIALTRASQQLCLTRSLADDEARLQSPSPFWTLLRNQFSALKPTRIDRQASIDCIGTPRQLATSLMHWVRRGNFTQTDSPWPSLYQWFASHDGGDDAIDTMRRQAWPALAYVNDAKLSQDVSARLFHSPLNASVSRIETFAACPFRHFVRYGLQLAER